jgi:hypothetical protein
LVSIDKDTIKSKPTQTFVPVSYPDAIKEIRGLLNVLKAANSIKSTEMDWYKNASKATDHLITIFGFNAERITKYAIHHYLDSANYRVKRTLFENVVDERVFEIDPEVETHISSYFRNFIMRSNSGDQEGIYIANREDAVFIVRNTKNVEDREWQERDKFDAEDFKNDSAKYTVNKSVLNNIIGYMIQFKDQDMSFYYKDINLKRNKKGRRCDRSGGKAPILDMLNRVVGTKMYTEENTSTTMYSGTLCVVLEMILRKFHDERKTSKIYYLTPEQAIQNKITDYSAAV